MKKGPGHRSRARDKRGSADPQPTISPAAETHTMPRLIHLDGILEDWHPLQNDGAAPEYIPSQWTGPHVGKRLVDSYRTLAKLPMANGPRFHSGFWPEHVREWQDQLAELEADIEQQQADARAQNRTRILPSATEISRMETAIAWPATYLAKTRPILAKTV